MKLRDLMDKAHKELESQREEEALETIKRKLLVIEELNKAIKSAEKNLNTLLETDLEDFEYNVW